MTLLGKLFVMFNLVLSLMLGATAFGVFSSGLDFSDTPAKGSQPAGKLLPVKTDLDETLKQMPIVETSWQTARTELLAREDKRRLERDWYATELRKLVVEKGKIQEVDQNQEKANEQKREQDRARTGILAPAALPVLAFAKDPGGADLMGLPFYVARLASLRADNAAVRKMLDEKLREDTVLTRKLAGDPENPKVRGLRQQVAEERVKKAGIMDEQGIAEGMRINSAVESELIFKRLEALDERIQELVRYLKKKHNVDVPARWR
jgi:hypothetical protein